MMFLTLLHNYFAANARAKKIFTGSLCTVLDPWCGTSSYNGHKGTDIRLRTVNDIAFGYEVLAAASGVVKAVRDGEPDMLIVTKKDAERVRGKECGNGVVLAHGNGYETQYCHMKKGSIRVKSGQRIETGETIGLIGLSGHTQFPHLHLTLRKDGSWIDLVSGERPKGFCAGVLDANTYLSANGRATLPISPRQIIASGISGSRVDHNKLVSSGLPGPASTNDKLTIGWVWLINLSKGDEIHLRLTDPTGRVRENSLDPLTRGKAAYSAYIGSRTSPVPGAYELSINVTNERQIVLKKRFEYFVE